VTPTANGWAKLTSLPSKHEADLLAGRLREAGIRARIVKATDDPAGWLRAYGGSGGLFHMYVPVARKRAARQLLVGSRASRSAGVDRSYHRPILIIGRGLLVLAMGSVVAFFLFDALR